MQLPWPPAAKRILPAATSAGTLLVGRRGERIVLTHAVTSAQSPITLCGCALVPAGSAASALDPWSPCCGGVEAAVLMRSCTPMAHLRVAAVQMPLGQSVAW